MEKLKEKRGNTSSLQLPPFGSQKDLGKSTSTF